jgi:hypothetical protein
MKPDVIYEVPEDIWKDFQRVSRGNGPLHEWWKYVRIAIQNGAQVVMFADSWKPRY